MKPKGYVIWHRDGMGTMKAFDIFVRRGSVRKYKEKFSWLYRVKCLVAEFWKKKLKGYVYIGSEDDLHAFPINLKVPRGFKVIHFDDDYDEEFKDFMKKNYPEEFKELWSD